MRKTLIRPTDAEDALITAAALTDSENPPMNDEQLAQLKRGPGRPLGSAKELVSLRLDTDVLNAFRAGGSGWQTRINEVLKNWAVRH
jgi:uncharacterized protein (DUF4415 family)